MLIRFLSILLLSLIVYNNGSSQWEILWEKNLQDMSFGNAAMADLDGDGNMEIAFSTYRNDERLIVLNAEDGTIFWEYNTGGCNDAAPLIFDVDLDNELEIIVASSCNPRTFCFDGATGELEWSTQTHGSDSPPSAGDVDNDGKPEVLHGGFGGWLTCLNGEDGSIAYDIHVDPDSWIQTAPTLLDIGNDGELDFVVANWSFIDDHKIFGFDGENGELIWESDLPEDVIYHGVSVGDLDNDGNDELVIGDYSGKLMVINAEDGSLFFEYRSQPSYSISAPTNLADLNGDGFLEIILFDWFQLIVLDHQGNEIWKFNIPDYPSVFRGCAISDMDGDDMLDLAFACSDGKIYTLKGYSGELINSFDLKEEVTEDDFELQHGPILSDFNGDGKMDIFIAGGHAEYPEIENNYGRAFAIGTNHEGGPDWPMFRRDARRRSCVCDTLTSSILISDTEKEYLLYYDATRKELNIEDLREEKGVIQLFNIEGKIILTKGLSGSKNISVEGIDNGPYFVKWINSEREYTWKFVKY